MYRYGERSPSVVKTQFPNKLSFLVGDQHMKLQLLAESGEPAYPIGFKLFKVLRLGRLCECHYDFSFNYLSKSNYDLYKLHWYFC